MKLYLKRYGQKTFAITIDLYSISFSNQNMVDLAAAKRIQWDTKEQHLEPFEGFNVQLVFREKNFYSINHTNIKKWLEKYHIRPISIHYPTFKGLEKNFIGNLKFLKDNYGQNLFTTHPKFGSMEDLTTALRSKEDEILELGVTLAYENMPGPEGKWNCYPTNLHKLDFPFTRLTLDVTHLEESVNEIEEFNSVSDKVNVIHLSNVRYNNGKRDDHLPINDGDRNLNDFIIHLKKEDYKGQIILEYNPETANLLARDIQTVENLINNRKYEPNEIGVK